MGVSNSRTGQSVADSTCDDGIDIDAISFALSAILEERSTKRPEGFTAEEYAKKRNIAVRTAQEQLRRLYQNDYADRAIWKNGVNKMTYIYRLKRKV